MSEDIKSWEGPAVAGPFYEMLSFSNVLVIRPWTAEDDPRLMPWLKRARREMPEAHTKRQHEWALAREALQGAMLIPGAELNVESAVFVGFQQVEQFPDWRFSLTHTDGWAACWAIPQCELKGIGLDIELKTRQISSEISERIAHEDDVSLDPLQLWAIKEAAYKTFSPADQQGLWLKDVSVGPESFELAGVTGRWQCDAHKDLWVIKAWID